MIDDIKLDLSGNNISIILDRLYYLQGHNEFGIDKDVSDIVSKLMFHEDTQVRQEAINLFAIHWMREEAFPILLSMKNDGQFDDGVIDTVCAALGTLVLKGKGSRDQAAQFLLNVLSDKSYGQETKGNAYLNIMRMYNFLSVKDFARLGISPEKVEINYSLLKDIEDKIEFI